MSSQSSVVVQAAQAVRPYLRELLPPREAEVADKRLALMLQSSEDTTAQAEEIRVLLSAAEVTREWLRLYVEERQPATEILKVIRTYHPLPGKGGAIASPKYRCPVANCHQTWYRRQVEDRIPECPIHGVNMVRDSKVHTES